MTLDGNIQLALLFYRKDVSDTNTLDSIALCLMSTSLQEFPWYLSSIIIWHIWHSNK